jgi:predicted O-methyltransferase YrrM
MSDLEFIEFCYKKILRREPDKEGEIHYANALSSRHLTREDMMIKFVYSEEFESRVASQEFVPQGHFYSAIPSIADRETFLSIPSSDDEILGINLNTQKQIDLLKQFKKYHDQCPFPEHKTDQFRYYFSNPAYSYTDALTLYSMIRQFKPKRIIEIGSGYSSSVMLDTNDLFFNGEINFTFIEPYPELFHSLLKQDDKKNLIISRKLQEVDNSIFSSLQANDILFVDSTHVSKLNSDVNRIIFEILTSLQKGVLIHFHDIFWPFEYPKEWILEGRAWNEAYILRAFLEFNESFEILLFSSYLHRYQAKWFQENMPLYLKNTGGNIWIRKIKG